MFYRRFQKFMVAVLLLLHTSAASFAATTRAFAASTCASFSESAEFEEGESARASCERWSDGASVGVPVSGGLPSCAIELS